MPHYGKNDDVLGNKKPIKKLAKKAKGKKKK